MSKIVAYMVTWTTYGSWLPGDERGYVKDGRILRSDARILRQNAKRQKHVTVRLNTKEREMIREVIIAEARRAKHKIEALVVYSNHVHLLARPHRDSIEETTGRYKSLTTRALWENGRKGRIWTKGFDKRYCFKEEDLERRVGYIENHKGD
jgi:REP element-mobilizing transposase RayT